MSPIKLYYFDVRGRGEVSDGDDLPQDIFLAPCSISADPSDTSLN